MIDKAYKTVRGAFNYAKSYLLDDTDIIMVYRDDRKKYRVRRVDVNNGEKIVMGACSVFVGFVKKDTSFDDFKKDLEFVFGGYAHKNRSDFTINWSEYNAGNMK